MIEIDAANINEHCSIKQIYFQKTIIIYFSLALFYDIKKTQKNFQQHFAINAHANKYTIMQSSENE